MRAGNSGRAERRRRIPESDRPAITASAAYRAHGLIVITFGTVGNATASSLPAGASTATLSSEPPVGVLLLSPFARAGARPTTRLQPNFPQAEPFRASALTVTSAVRTSAVLKPTKETHVARTQSRPPQEATWWLVALVGCTLALLLATPAISHAEESNPNNYSCLGSIAPGKPEVGSEEQQVAYVFYCNGPITGYQLQAQIPLTGVQSPPLVTAGASVWALRRAKR